MARLGQKSPVDLTMQTCCRIGAEDTQFECNHKYLPHRTLWEKKNDAWNLHLCLEPRKKEKKNEGIIFVM